jgi:hypothetical protein
MIRLVVLASVAAMLAVPTVSGPALAASPRCQGVKATIVGTAGNDRLAGTSGRDVIVAGAGADRIVAGGGNDLVCGGTGDDTILGGGGRDRLFGDDGFDVLKGDDGADVLNGGLGVDGCYAGAGGASIVACEDADLWATIRASTPVTDDVPFSYEIRVRNVGGKPSSAFDLRVQETLSNVTCGFTPPASTSIAALQPRTSYVFTVDHELGCSINESASEWHVDVHASVSYAGVDANRSNDTDDARIEVVPVVL